MNYFNIKELKKAYDNGKNISKLLRERLNSSINSSDIIEIAYDLQSGSYISILEKNYKKFKEHNDELVEFLLPYTSINSTILDAGAGEFTNLSLYFQNKSLKAKKVLAFDISWSRINMGIQFWNKTVKRDDIKLIPFVSDIAKIPLPSKSVEIVTTRHALEPNGGKLKECLSELFRVASKYLILFEPHYEIASEKGKKRMESHGYIKDMEKTIESLGGNLISVTQTKTNYSDLNPISCFVVEPPHLNDSITKVEIFNNKIFTVPSTNFQLFEEGNFLYSPDTGHIFPIFNSIPVLKENSSFIATDYCLNKIK